VAAAFLPHNLSLHQQHQQHTHLAHQHNAHHLLHASGKNRSKNKTLRPFTSASVYSIKVFNLLDLGFEMISLHKLN